MMINFQAAFLSLPPSKMDSFETTLLSGIRRSTIDRLRLNGIPASVDGRRRIEPVGDEGIDMEGVVPRRLDWEVPKYEEAGRAGDAGVMIKEVVERWPEEEDCSCSRMSLICKVSIIKSRRVNWGNQSNNSPVLRVNDPACQAQAMHSAKQHSLRAAFAQSRGERTS